MVVAGIRTSRGDERRRVLVAKGAAGVAWFALMAMSVACQEGPDERRDATVKEVPGDPPDDGGVGEGAVEARFAADLERICLPDGRRAGTRGHAQVAAYLEERLLTLGLAPYVGESLRIPYEREDLGFTNLVGVVPGRDRALAPVLIGAHYDSAIDAPSADDNAAAVCIALEVARRLVRADPPPRDVAIALFDAEEPPHFHSPTMGSTRFHRDSADERGFHAALVMDLVGHDVHLPVPGGEGLADVMFVTGTESHPALLPVVEPRVRVEGLRIVAARNEYVGDMSDHHTFRLGGVPFLFLSCGRWEHYHQPTDTVDRLSPSKMARIAAWLHDVTVAAATADLGADPLDLLEEGAEDFTLALERETIGAALASLPAETREALGLRTPSTRAEVTAIAVALLRAGL